MSAPRDGWSRMWRGPDCRKTGESVNINLFHSSRGTAPRSRSDEDALRSVPAEQAPRPSAGGKVRHDGPLCRDVTFRHPASWTRGRLRTMHRCTRRGRRPGGCRSRRAGLINPRLINPRHRLRQYRRPGSVCLRDSGRVPRNFRGGRRESRLLPHIQPRTPAAGRHQQLDTSRWRRDLSR